nr:PREDICTED: uncharacterized protein LOC105674523 [Linepithema humile]XP_012226326.1 PREDICTED: uncharacterized protein LOC105674523 [Linepithema humile]XP_012226327.1 PREDICTED: uncharacterized protein LOC105674523 [Linepithema humile]XP_012226328.1 PREDICTED: uncharacterized protein LOC105674523 [Linepithema humile]XP_012226329.1 PREDICTED: uncharacterized protein LOC105674523 [Linepithema humile]
MSFKMCVTVIPFVLRALLFVEDVQEWNFGPEYVFELTKSIRTYVTDKHSIGQRITAVVKCRLNVLSQSDKNIHFCNASDIIVTNMTQKKNGNWEEMIVDRHSATPHKQSKKIPHQLFKIDFSENGVQDFTLKTKQKQRYYNIIADIIADIIDLFSLDIDLNIVRRRMKNYESFSDRPYVIFSFTNHQENTTRAIECNTSGTVEYTPLHQHNENETFGVQNNEKETNKTKFDFQLALLPICYGKDKYPASETLVIDKIRNACTHQRTNLRFLNSKWKLINVTEYSNRIQIHNKKPKFASQTHIQGNVFLPMSTTIVYKFQENVSLQLVRIKAARIKLNTAEYDWDYYEIEETNG